MTDSIKRLKELVDSSDNIVFFGGAGVSTESGIPDFRSTGGLYHQEWKYPPEVILSHTFYESNPEEFFRFYRAKLLAPDAKPNAAHKKLAEWEAEGRLKAVITQNIDGLHQAAGSRNVLSSTAASTGTTASGAGNFTVWSISSARRACPGAAAAASSSRMWCSMRRGWIRGRWRQPSAPWRRRIC